MPKELFIMPMIGSGTREWGIDDSYRGKYTRDAAVTQQGCIRYSRLDDAICMLDATQVYLDATAAQTDVTRLATAATIDNVLTTEQAASAKTVFEDAFIPGEMINAGDTRREAIRAVVGMFLFSQRMEGTFGEGWKAKAQSRGMTLDSTWADFPQVLKDEFIVIHDSFGWSLSELSNASTMREILVVVSNEFKDTPFFIAGVQV
jgi:hypothetical protein